MEFSELVQQVRLRPGLMLQVRAKSISALVSTSNPALLRLAKLTVLVLFISGLVRATNPP